MPTQTLTFNQIRLALVAIAGTALISCQSDAHQQIEQVARAMKDNSCQMELISKYVDDAWTKSIEELGNRLPKSLPQQERQNILNLKNANLIRMFESYNTFDDNVHSLVDSMEVMDMSWADSLRQLSLKNQMLEMKMDSLFTLVGDRETEQMLLQQVEEIKTTPCRDENSLEM